MAIKRDLGWQRYRRRPVSRRRPRKKQYRPWPRRRSGSPAPLSTWNKSEITWRSRNRLNGPDQMWTLGQPHRRVVPKEHFSILYRTPACILSYDPCPCQRLLPAGWVVTAVGIGHEVKSKSLARPSRLALTCVRDAARIPLRRHSPPNSCNN